MKKKRHEHSCEMGNIAGGKRTTSGRISRKSKRNDKKAVKNIYDRFYREQVAALYRAVRAD